MSMFKSLGEALSANINNTIENNSRPDVMARYYADKAHRELDVSRNRTISVMADTAALEREIKQNESDIATLTAYAEKAMQAGNKADAAKFLIIKKNITDKLAESKKTLEAAKRAEEETIAAYDAHAKEVAAMDSDMHEIKANVAIAESKTAASRFPSAMSNRATTMFAKMKNRSRRMVDEANACEQICDNSSPEAVKALMTKYDEPVDVVAEELAALEKKYS